MVVKNEKSDYDIRAEDFLKKTGTEFSFKFLKHDHFFNDDKENKEKRDIYEITLKRGERSYSFSFGQSITCSGRWFVWRNGKEVFSSEKKPSIYGVRIERNKEFAEPSAYDVLTCLKKHDVGSFEDFCGDFGYNLDSIRANKTYLAVKKEFEELQRLFYDKELDEMDLIE
jgi:hypothetical protein